VIQNAGWTIKVIATIILSPIRPSPFKQKKTKSKFQNYEPTDIQKSRPFLAAHEKNPS
jgi:hypothetical protein